MRIVCIADTHGMHEQLSVPDGDVLIHAGDFTRHGSVSELLFFNAWLLSLPHKDKVVIAGNHDWCFERDPYTARREMRACHYLEDSGITIKGIKFWGSPWQPVFYNWAFNAKPEKLKEKWQLIPSDTNVLITHGPPYGCGDLTEDGVSAGCEHLRVRTGDMNLSLHAFGHIHEGYGQRGNRVNCSVLDARYRLVNKPIVIDL